MAGFGFIVILVLVVVIVLVVIGFGVGFIRLERRKSRQEAETDLFPDLEPTLQDPFSDDAPSFAEALEEAVDFFADPDPEPEEAAEPEEELISNTEAEEAVYDRLSSFRAGRSFLVECQNTLNTAFAEGRSFAVACFDFDRFQFVNSLKGYSIGDYALTKMSQEMVEIFPEGSICTRVSADHFLVLFPYIDDALVEDYIEQLRRTTEHIRSDVNAKSGMRVFVGLAKATSGINYDIGVLIQKANIARHSLKDAKTEMMTWYDRAMITSYLFGESALDDYTDNQYEGDFNLYFMPLADLTKNRLIGGEALVRWKCEDDTFSYIPVTPDNGRIPTNNIKILYHVCRHLGRWRKAGKDISCVCAHLPVTDLLKHDIDALIARCLNDFQIDPSGLIIEIDHSVIRTDREMIALQMKKISDLGVKIAVFGVDRAFTTLEGLGGLPISYVKLHKSFAHDIERNPERVSAVETMQASARSMNITVIYEGVENQVQAGLLKKAGAVLVQGQYAGRAYLPDDFARNLQEYSSRSRGLHDSTTILDDDTLAKGEFKVF